MSQINREVNSLFGRDERRPNRRTWLKHIIFLLLTLLTATLAGAFQPFGRLDSPLFALENFLDSWWIVPLLPMALTYAFVTALQTVFGDHAVLAEGLKFSVSLLTILTAHEMGHYVACRIYKVDATLPFFIPLPLISPAGTLGAFIKILSPMPSPRATFDIGVAGPIAGFVTLVPVAVLGILTAHPAASPQTAEAVEFVFSKPLLMQIIAYFAGVNLNLMQTNPFYMAAWVGLLVTALNLIPSGQLDGGHAVFAIFGRKIHRWTGKIAFAAMITITTLGIYFYSSPSGLLFTILLGIMMRVRHPEPLYDEPLGWQRKFVAFLTLIIFALSFVPFPIQVL